jgi:hypothetical protein
MCTRLQRNAICDTSGSNVSAIAFLATRDVMLALDHYSLLGTPRSSYPLIETNVTIVSLEDLSSSGIAFCLLWARKIKRFRGGETADSGEGDETRRFALAR